MRIGEFARRAGVSASKVRFYEARGLLPRPMRRPNGYRTYGEADLRVLTLVDEARALGFPLAAIARFMGRPAPERHDKARLIPALERRLAAVDLHIADSMRQRDRIVSLIASILDREGHR